MASIIQINVTHINLSLAEIVERLSAFLEDICHASPRLREAMCATEVSSDYSENVMLELYSSSFGDLSEFLSLVDSVAIGTHVDLGAYKLDLELSIVKLPHVMGGTVDHYSIVMCTSEDEYKLLADPMSDDCIIDRKFKARLIWFATEISHAMGALIFELSFPAYEDLTPIKVGERIESILHAPAEWAQMQSDYRLHGGQLEYSTLLLATIAPITGIQRRMCSIEKMVEAWGLDSVQLSTRGYIILDLLKR